MVNQLSECTGVDENEFPNMFIPALPADEGEELEVQCYGGTVQLGSDTVTCNKGTEFTFNIKPECKKLGKTIFILIPPNFNQIHNSNLDKNIPRFF